MKLSMCYHIAGGTEAVLIEILKLPIKMQFKITVSCDPEVGSHGS